MVMMPCQGRNSGANVPVSILTSPPETMANAVTWYNEDNSNIIKTIKMLFSY